MADTPHAVALETPNRPALVRAAARRPECRGQMMEIAFIERPQADPIAKILRRCGLWHASSPRAPSRDDAWGHAPDRNADRHPASSDVQGADVAGAQIRKVLSVLRPEYSKLSSTKCRKVPQERSRKGLDSFFSPGLVPVLLRAAVPLGIR